MRIQETKWKIENVFISIAYFEKDCIMVHMTCKL